MDTTPHCSICGVDRDYSDHNCLNELRKELGALVNGRSTDNMTEADMMSNRQKLKELELRAKHVLNTRKESLEHARLAMESASKFQDHVETRRDTIRTALIDAMGDN